MSAEQTEDGAPVRDARGENRPDRPCRICRWCKCWLPVEYDEDECAHAPPSVRAALARYRGGGRGEGMNSKGESGEGR